MDGPENTQTKPRPAHLYKPGQAGPGGGRKKGGVSFKKLMNELLDHRVDNPSKTFYGGKKHITASQLMLIALFKKAIKGDVRAMEQFFDRADEVVTQKVEITNHMDSPEDEIILREYVLRQKMLKTESEDDC